MSNPQPWLSIVITSFFSCTAVQAQEAPLILGLDAQSNATTTIQSSDNKKNRTSPVLSGFWDTRVGTRLQEDKFEDQTSLAETRLRLNLDLPGEQTTFHLKTDFVYDDQEDEHDIDLETGQGFLDLREASLQFKPLPNLDIKAGRQTLAWHKGSNILAINDRFPKDYRSYALGRDSEYLRAPSDAIKLSLDSQLAKLDLVYTPRFDANRYVDGSRLSLFNARLGRISGDDAILQVEKPAESFKDDEIALRLSRKIQGKEASLYAYRGFWKSPEGINPRTGKAIFPELSVYGASLRGRIGQYGGGKIEMGYYDSMEDSDGSSPFIRNSEARFLVGYKQALAKNLRVGAQYYLERKLDYDAYKRSVPANRIAADENRHILNFRVKHWRMDQRLLLSLVGFYSPSDEDGYLRPQLSYKLNKDWTVESGVNWFFGESEQTFFGQLEDNSNIYMGFRYNFANL